MKAKIGVGSIGDLPAKGGIVELDEEDIAKAGAGLLNAIGIGVLVVVGLFVLLAFAIVEFVRAFWPLILGITIIAVILYFFYWRWLFRGEVNLVAKQLRMLQEVRDHFSFLSTKEREILRDSAEPLERKAIQATLNNARSREFKASEQLLATLVHDLEAIERRLSELASSYASVRDYERSAAPHRHALAKVRELLAHTRSTFEPTTDERDHLKQRYPLADFLAADRARSIRLRAYYPPKGRPSEAVLSEGNPKL